MRAIFSLTAAVLVALYLFALWSDWFTWAEFAVEGRRPLYSDNIDLRKSGPIVWSLPPEKNRFAQKEAHLGLSLNLETLKEIPRDRHQVQLRVKMSAEGRTPGGEWQNRLIKDWYFTTDEPFSERCSIWESYGMGQLEYGLAGIEIVPDEELRITLDVQVPDARLMSGNPRMSLVGKHDYAATMPEILAIWILKNGGIIVSLLLLFTLMILAGQQRRRPLLLGGTATASAEKA
jgi:hypothetical protein